MLSLLIVFLLSLFWLIVPKYLSIPVFIFFFLNNPAPTEIYPLPLPDALPIKAWSSRSSRWTPGSRPRCSGDAEQPEQPRGRRQDEVEGTEPVEHAAVPGNERRRVLDARLALEQRLSDVADLRRHRHHHPHRCQLHDAKLQGHSIEHQGTVHQRRNEPADESP